MLSLVSDDKVFHFEIQESRTDGEVRRKGTPTEEGVVIDPSGMYRDVHKN